MQLSTGEPFQSVQGEKTHRALPSLVEALLVLIAMAALLPAFARLADLGPGRDQRFADIGFRVRGLPEPSLPAVCAQYGTLAEPAVRERLCGGMPVGAPAPPPSRLPVVLTDALVRSAHAFFEPVRDVEARLQALRSQQREGIGDLRNLADAITSLETQTRPYLDRFQLKDGNARGPAALTCAVQSVEAALAEPVEPGVARANAVLLLASAFDGHAATEALANTAMLPLSKVQALPPCAARAMPVAVSAASALMADARQSLLNARKNEAMRTLLQSAGWQWAGWMLLGWVLLQWSRHDASPAVGAAAALALWALAAWVGRVPWPLAGNRDFEPARAEAATWNAPAGFVLWLAGIAVALLLFAALARKRIGARRPQTLSSRIGYPGLVFATGLGWLILLDLSATGHAGNRYLALYHQGHLWLGMLVLGVLSFMRQPLARALAWTMAIAGELAESVGRRLGPWRAIAGLALLALALVGVLGLSLSNMRQFTSELGRVWLIVGAAWFFFLRGDPLAERLARSGGSAGSLLRYVWPLLFVTLVLIGAMLVTRDMGPLLIACYGAGAFLAASVAMWWHQRTGQTRSAFALAVASFAAWIAVTTWALFRVGTVDDVTAARLESLAAPLSSTNDQLALVSWFQRVVPPDGFGIGAAPWCGHSPAGSCSGVPAQIHSDYTFTAIVGVFGWAAAWVVALGCAFWLHRLIRHHGRVTRGEPLFVRHWDRIANDDQAFLSWVCVAWVVLTLCQLAVTVAGNLAVLPLTGVTFPFVSFGMTSLVVNMAFLALCLNLNLPARGPHG